MSKTAFIDRVLDAIQHLDGTQRYFEDTKRIIPTNYSQTLVIEAERSVHHAKEQLQFALDSYIDYRITILMRNRQ